MAIKKQLSITLKSGFVCKHEPVAESEEKWWGFIVDVMSKLDVGGVLATQAPYGFHRMDDISAVHFGDVDVPPETPPVGFLIPS